MHFHALRVIGDLEAIKYSRMCDVLSDFSGGVSEVSVQFVVNLQLIYW